jgi:hypothetical protein
MDLHSTVCIPGGGWLVYAVNSIERAVCITICMGQRPGDNWP